MQVEFSRRYEGATLRAATAADLTREQADEYFKNCEQIQKLAAGKPIREKG